MDTNKPAVVAASIHTIRTRVDGTLTVTLQVEPSHANDWVQIFGTMSGTPVAVARLSNEAANRAAQQDAIRGQWGQAYQSLYTLGWFNNPQVVSAFGFSMENPPVSERADAIKSAIYDKLGVNSLSQVHPYVFAQLCEQMGLRRTLPSGFGESKWGEA